LKSGAVEAAGKAGESKIESKGMTMENVPEKYRDAVKRYFGGEGKNEK
jgi:hypothetical protein